jgi:flavin-dependent thymidylate synthase
MNKNTVELLGFYGSDQIIAQSAWTSTSRDMTQEKLERVAKLVVTLWSQGHETPFEKATVHFLVNADIASHIHLLKHRMSSLNGESARYKELKEDKFYLPEDWKNIESNNSSSSQNSETLDWLNILKCYTEKGNQLYHQCLEDLTPILGRKRAKESARFFKTYNSQIQADVMFNLRSFANFLRLRNSNHAQLEIRDIAKQMQEQVKTIEDKPFQAAMWVITRANELWVEAQEKISKQLINEFELNNS